MSKDIRPAFVTAKLGSVFKIATYEYELGNVDIWGLVGGIGKNVHIARNDGPYKTKRGRLNSVVLPDSVP